MFVCVVDVFKCSLTPEMHLGLLCWSFQFIVALPGSKLYSLLGSTTRSSAHPNCPVTGK